MGIGGRDLEAEMRVAIEAKQEEFRKLTDDQFIRLADTMYDGYYQAGDGGSQARWEFQARSAAIVKERDRRDNAGLFSHRLLTSDGRAKRRQWNELAQRMEERSLLILNSKFERPF